MLCIKGPLHSGVNCRPVRNFCTNQHADDGSMQARTFRKVKVQWGLIVIQNLVIAFDPAAV